ncbi:hypothetical protein HK104_004852 [Borealophlyctis nickersoniae]|nr:hypothetical protein HK104_004852 [Borealophlyctis nickersoniae]
MSSICTGTPPQVLELCLYTLGIGLLIRPGFKLFKLSDTRKSLKLMAALVPTTILYLSLLVTLGHMEMGCADAAYTKFVDLVLSAIEIVITTALLWLAYQRSAAMHGTNYRKVKQFQFVVFAFTIVAMIRYAFLVHKYFFTIPSEDAVRFRNIRRNLYSSSNMTMEIFFVAFNLNFIIRLCNTSGASKFGYDIEKFLNYGLEIAVSIVSVINVGITATSTTNEALNALPKIGLALCLCDFIDFGVRLQELKSGSQPTSSGQGKMQLHSIGSPLEEKRPMSTYGSTIEVEGLEILRGR